MNKTELVEAVAKDSGLSNADARKAVESRMAAGRVLDDAVLHAVQRVALIDDRLMNRRITAAHSPGINLINRVDLEALAPHQPPRGHRDGRFSITI